MNIINVDSLTKDYGQNRGVFDVSFNVTEGQVFGYLGPNGAGKSTTIRHLMGFSKPDSGSTKIFGKDTFNNYNEILKNVGYIPGEIALPAGLTGWEFINMMQNIKGNKNEDNLKKLINIFELDPSGETKRMSLGVKRKLAIVTAFMSDPDVLILDEPTSGLDPVMQEVFIDYIKNQKKQGKTILLSSHIFSEVDATCDKIAIIKDGKIVSDFVADDLKHSSTKIYELTFSNIEVYNRFINTNKNNTYFTIINSNPDCKMLTVKTEDMDINYFIKVISDFDIVNFSHKKETLENYFMKYYKEDLDYNGVL